MRATCLTECAPDEWLRVREEWVSFLRPIPWTIIAHLTFGSENITPATAWKEFHHQFRRKAERRLNQRRPITWFACEERQKRGALHFSVLLADIDSIHHDELRCLWPGNAKIEPFDENQRMEGIRYVVKDSAHGANADCGGPRFPGRKSNATASPSPGGTPRRRDQLFLTIHPNQFERTIIDHAFDVLRAKPRIGPFAKSSWLFELSCLEFIASGRPTLDERTRWYLRLLEHGSGIDAGLVFVKAFPQEVGSSEEGSRYPLAFSLFRNGRGSQWDTVLMALHRAQQMSPGMSREAALCWIALDVLLTHDALKCCGPDGTPMGVFLIRHLANLTGGRAVAFESKSGELLIGSDVVSGLD